MANRLNENLINRVVIIDASEIKPEFNTPARRAFRVSSGFGASSFTSGHAIGGEFLFDGERCRMEGWQVERFATEEEIAAAEAIREAAKS